MLAAESSAASTWIPIATLLLGFATGQIADWVKDRRTYHRERDARAETRNDAKRERRNAFQRETLLSLQDAALEVIRNATQLHSFDVEMYVKHGLRGAEPYPADIDAACTVANAKTALLGVRIADEEVRRLLQQMKDCCTTAFFLRTSYEDAVNKSSEAGRYFVALNQRIGLVLRKLDAEDTTSAG